MVEALNPLEVHPMCMSHIYNVFWYLDMLWMGIWVHTLVTLLCMCRVRGGFLNDWDLTESE